MQGEQAARATPVPFVLGVVPWRQGRRFNITVVVKATFLAKTSPASPANAPQPYRISDAHHKNQPLARVTAASDRVPLKPRVDVTVLGNAHAPRGKTVAEMTARIALLHEGEILIDKSVRVVGARRSADSPPLPFVRMPIIYERAYGGIGVSDNLIGCGEEDAEEDDQPNILDPRDSSRPAGFGPLSAAWPARKKLLGNVPVKDIEAPLMILPNNFDGLYFQSAPLDQQLDELPPSAQLVLEGFDPERERIEIELPDARAMGAIYGLDKDNPDRATPIEFRADTLQLDTENWILTLTFRGHIEIQDPSVLDQVVVATGIGIGGRTPIIPDLRPSADKIRPAAEVSPAANDDLGGTLMLGYDEPAPGAVLPFVPSGESRPPTGRSSDTLVLPLSSWSKGSPRDLSTATLALPSSAPKWAMPAAMPPPLRPASVPMPPPSSPASVPMPPAAPMGISPPPLLHPLISPQERETQGPKYMPPPLLHGPDSGPIPNQRPEESIGIDRYGYISALISESKRSPNEVFLAHEIDESTWRKADRHWRREIRHETENGKRERCTIFEDAWVRGWEELNPGRFGVAHYACLVKAEQQGRIRREMRTQGLEPALAMRLRRVWKRRIKANSTLAKAFERLLEDKDAEDSLEVR